MSRALETKRTRIKQKKEDTNESHVLEGQGDQLTLNHLGSDVARDEGIDTDLELAQLLGEGGGEAWEGSLLAA